ncbi:RHS repeat-associated core domain-containing protein [Paenibacillus rubinfantis]|uniref:RHS repeat-associated core domain-containing protein n=1 Tax=Paenibacillus rubinfantis TaxID=1720296 RepID=UPI0011DD8573|nr:RHS repeat-associated core domain-containing protein [Paenibacillus rubinfantis]
MSKAGRKWHSLLQWEAYLFGYTGLGYDDVSGLSFARARYFDSEIGRFVSEDTYEGTLRNPQSQNGYVYVENNPVAYVDPSGNFCVSPDGKDAHLGQCNRSDPTKYYVPDFMVNAFPYLRDGKVYGFHNFDMNKPGYKPLKTPYYSTFWEASGISKEEYFEQWVLAIPLADEIYTAGSTHVPINGLKIPKSSGGKKSKAPKSNAAQGTGKVKFSPNNLPKDPQEPIKNGWKDVTPEGMAKNTASREFIDPETGMKVRFDPGKPGANGFEGKDHYHVTNPNGTTKADYYLDANGNPVAKGSKASHIVP